MWLQIKKILNNILSENKNTDKKTDNSTLSVIEQSVSTNLPINQTVLPQNLPIINNHVLNDTEKLYYDGEEISPKDDLNVLGLPVRLENALKNGDITTVGKFYCYPENELFNIRNIGSKSLVYLRLVKNNIKYDSNEKHAGQINDKTVQGSNNNLPIGLSEPFVSNDQLLKLLLDRCGDDRSKKVISRRFGLDTGERETLEEIGQDYEITRERVRQLQMKSIRKMRHPSTKSRKRMIFLIETMLFKHGGIISDLEADELVPGVFGDKAYDGSSLLDLISEIGWIQRYRVGDVILYSPKITNLNLSVSIDRVISFLGKAKQEMTIEQIMNYLPFLKEVSHSQFRVGEFLARYCRLDPRIEERSDGLFCLYKTTVATSSWSFFINRVLEEAGMPLHFTEITDKVNDLLVNNKKGRHLDVRRAHSVLIDNKLFAHTGIRGTYGLTEWGLRKESTPDLVAECMKKAGFPIHIDQIFHYVSKYKNTKRANIGSVLTFNDRFENKGKGLYYFKNI